MIGADEYLSGYQYLLDFVEKWSSKIYSTTKDATTSAYSSVVESTVQTMNSKFYPFPPNLMSSGGYLDQIIPEGPFEMILSSELFTNLGKLWQEFFATSFFGYLPERVRNSLQKVTFCTGILVYDMAFASKVVDFVFRMITSVREAIETQSVMSLLGRSRIERWADDYAAFHHKYLDFLSTRNPVVRDELEAEGRKLLREGPEIPKFNMTGNYSNFLSLQGLMSEFRNSQAHSRAEPVGLIISGPPGCGKTQCVTVLSNIAKRQAGLAPDANAVLFLSPILKHQDHMSDSPVVAVFNDAMDTKEEHMACAVVPMLQSAVDTAPWLI